MPVKGKVERPFRYIREDFFLGRSFRNLDDLNQQLRQWLDQVANARVHATTRRVVAEHFAEERPKLQRLPAGPFQVILRLERRITRDGMVSVDGNLYSVPNSTRRRPVEVHSTTGEIRIFEQDRLIAASLSIPSWMDECARHTQANQVATDPLDRGIRRELACHGLAARPARRRATAS